ncbi:hypothetical protein LWI29_024996 [Acer saccharum]|uniref:Uncharacterized protein n=1 Tax=Acer saccharum TaxID=4024 RepID=A0AA39TRB0_ACESA|nr:hypothetical protein LWI29_024996 [Acer saccharum]
MGSLCSNPVKDNVMVVTALLSFLGFESHPCHWELLLLLRLLLLLLLLLLFLSRCWWSVKEKVNSGSGW